MSSRSIPTEYTIQTDVEPGDKTGIYYITLCNLPFGATWRDLKNFTRCACPVDHVEVFESSTSAWVRVKGRRNFEKAWLLLNGGVFGGRSIIASDRNRTEHIKVKAFAQPPSYAASARPPTRFPEPTAKASCVSPASCPPPGYVLTPTSEIDFGGFFDLPARPKSTANILESGVSSGTATPTSTFTDPSYATQKPEVLYANAYANSLILPSRPQPYLSFFGQHFYSNQSYADPVYHDALYSSPADPIDGGTHNSALVQAAPSDKITPRKWKIIVTQIYRGASIRAVVAWLYDRIYPVADALCKVEVPRFESTGRLHGHAFLSFEDRFTARKAIALLNMNRFGGLTTYASFYNDMLMSKTVSSPPAPKKLPSPPREQRKVPTTPAPAVKTSQRPRRNGAKNTRPRSFGGTPKQTGKDSTILSKPAPVEETVPSPVIVCGSTRNTKSK